MQQNLKGPYRVPVGLFFGHGPIPYMCHNVHTGRCSIKIFNSKIVGGVKNIPRIQIKWQETDPQESQTIFFK